MTHNSLHQKVIRDFGEQWNALQDNSGYYGDIKVLEDICSPLLKIKDLQNKFIIDIGSGNGRLTNLLIKAGAAHVFSLEPSSSYNILLKNTEINKSKITYINTDGSNIPDYMSYDYAFSIGVLHHIPNPNPTIISAFNCLKKGGFMLIWVYGAEGNFLYLFMAKILRLITVLMPHNLLYKLSKFLIKPLKFYAFLSTHIKLPMYQYMRNHINKLNDSSLLITIYDQLNPSYAKYYKKHEALALLKSNGFQNCKIHHRHGYSWTIIGQKI